MKTWRACLFWGLALLAILKIAGVQAQDSDQTAVLLITEIFYDTPGADENEEWIELANLGAASIDLSDYKIGDEETAGEKEGMLRFPEGASIAPGEVILIAQSAAGLRNLTGLTADYEILATDTAVADMRGFPIWSGKNFGLANGGDELLLLDAQNKIVDAVNYGESLTYFDPSIGAVFKGQSIERVPADCDTDSAADWQTQEFPTPGKISFEGVCQIPEPVDEIETLPPIGVIQGTDDVAAKVNERVKFRGVVTGTYADINTSGITYYTIFVQDLVGQEDGDPATSDGIAIFVGQERPSVKIGDQLLVEGIVTEFYGLTELDDNNLSLEIEASGVPLPMPISVDPPAANDEMAAYFEPYESMLVTLTGTAQVVGPTFSGCGFSVVAEPDGIVRVFRHHLDDPIGQILPVLHVTDVDCGAFPDVKYGDTVAGLTGPLTYNFDQFKIVQQEVADLTLDFAPLPTIPAPPVAAEGQFSIATFNVENYFDVFDDTGDDAEPKPMADEIAIKQQKMAYAIGEVLGCPTLLALQEVEKAGLLTELADVTAEYCGFTYAVTHLESADIRGIDVALMSDPNKVTVENAQLRQTCTGVQTDITDPNIDCAVTEDPLFSRPPLQVDLTVDGEPYTVIVNHFKSKRGGELATAPRRVLQALHINELVAELLAEDGAARIIVLGDFNDYDLANPMLKMTEEGQLTNILQSVPDDERYSFVFGGASQLIDGILVSPALVDAVTAVTIQHVNADYPDSFGQDTSPEGLAFRSTDHDLPLAVFDLANLVPSEETEMSTFIPNPEPTPDPLPEENNNWLLWIFAGIAVAVVVVYWSLRYGRNAN